MEIPTTKAHYEKYAAIAERYPHIRLPFSKEEILETLQTGDIHLNKLPLKKWDMASYQITWTCQNGGRKYKILSEQVCTLKHIALYRIACCTPFFTTN